MVVVLIRFIIMMLNTVMIQLQKLNKSNDLNISKHWALTPPFVLWSMVVVFMLIRPHLQ